MARFDSLRREIGLLPPLQKFEDIQTVTARVQKWGCQPSPLAKALAGLERQMAKALRQTAKPAVKHVVVNPKAAARAKLAQVQKHTDILIKAGKLTAHEAAVIEVRMHDYARSHCE